MFATTISAYIDKEVKRSYFIYMSIWYGWFLGLGMLPTGTLSSPASASSVVEVRDLHREVGLDMAIIFVYNMSK